MTTTAPEAVEPNRDLGVDTTLKPQTLLGDTTDMPPGLENVLFNTVSAQDFGETFTRSAIPNGFSRTAAGGAKRDAIIEEAKKYLGVKYVWGGTTPNGFDCSGLTQYVLRKFGVNIPRVSQQQAGAGERRAVADLDVGDLVLFNHGASGVGHVAFYLGNGQILEAPRTGLNVRIRKLGKGESTFGVHLNID